MEEFNNRNTKLEMMINEEKDSLRLGDKAPMFNAMSTFGPLKLSDYMGRWLILFSHPGDFTPVCTTEFISLAKMNPEFAKRNCDLLGLSIDSNPSHLAWVNNIHKTTGIQIPFPVIADRDMKVAKMYGMIAPNQNNMQTVRSVFFIDPEQNIRAIFQYPATNGRNMMELLRLLDALQITDKEKVATPANWVPNQPTVIPSPSTYNELMERMDNPLGYNCLDWYLCFNQQNGVNPLLENQLNRNQLMRNNQI